MLFRDTVYNCKQATLLQIKREEKTITLFERMKLRYHLIACDPCRNFIRQSEQINRAGKNLQSLLDVHPPFQLPDSVKLQIQAEIDKSGK